MLVKPPSCSGCPLASISEGFMTPTLSSTPNGVMLIGEALGEQEAKSGEPFIGSSGFHLTRLIEYAGLRREDFDIINAVWCRPPGNLLDGQAYERGAVAHCRSNHWDHLLSRARVLVPLGNVALHAVTGVRKGILQLRGYTRPGPGTTYCLPTVHPAFIRRGMSRYAAAFIHDLQKACELAASGLPIEPTDYIIDPSPELAYRWAQEYIQAGSPRLAFDIETPGKKEDESESDDEQEFNGDSGDRTYFIYRIGFSYRGLSGLSVPWTPPYMATIRTLMESRGDKVVWNAGFDCPRIRAKGVGINGLVHDGMVAWHILHSDLPKGLGFVATFTCPWQHEWKSMSGSHPGLYNVIDADVELRSMEVIERELRASGLWEVYREDVLEMDPILVQMSTAGMPVDPGRRHERAVSLDDLLGRLQHTIDAGVPELAHRYEPKSGFVRAPGTTEGLVQLTVEAEVRRCDRCGTLNPPSSHFKTLKKPTIKKPQNPCGGAGVVKTIEPIQRWARRLPFKASLVGMIRYQNAFARPIPTKWDKKDQNRKASFDDKALKTLTNQYPDDTIYPSILAYREADKLAGTYIGRPRTSNLAR